MKIISRFKRTLARLGQSSLTALALLATGNAVLAQTQSLPALIGQVQAVANSALPQVATAAALKAYSGMATTVLRLGAIAQGDSPPATYTLSGSPCSIPGGDVGSQVPSATGGCWKLNPTMRVPLSLWVGKGSSDDSAAWAAALAYLGSLGGPRMLWDDLPSSSVGGVRLVIPSQVTISGDGTYEGSDATNLPTATFSGANGGFACGYGAAVHGLNLTAANGSVDHLIELTGQCGLDVVRMTYSVNGVAMSRTLVQGQAAPNLGVNRGSGLTNGTYSGVAFTGGGGVGATLTIGVSNGAIQQVAVNGYGIGYAPWFDWGLLAGALYPGSPAIPVVGQIGTANTGRSRFHHLFGIASGGNGTKIGIEVDSAYDYVTIEDVELWNPAGIAPGSIGFRFGHVDGASIISPKLFSMDTGVLWGGDVTAATQGFLSIVAPEIDYGNIGISVSFPGDQLAISGGYARTIGKALLVNAPSLHLSATGTSYLVQSDAAMTLLDFTEASITGNGFYSGNTSTSTPEVIWGSGSGSMMGAGLFSASGNVFDGSHPAFLEDATGKGGTLGANRWAGRNYPATDGNGNATRGYFTMAGAVVDVEAIRHRQIGFTADANGNYTWTHSIGSQGTAQTVTLIAACAAAGYRAAITAFAPDSVTFTVLDRSGAAVANAQCAARVDA